MDTTKDNMYAMHAMLSERLDTCEAERNHYERVLRVIAEDDGDNIDLIRKFANAALKKSLVSVEPEWCYSNDPEELALAAQGGMIVEEERRGRWWWITYDSPDEFSQGIRNGLKYRIGPKPDPDEWTPSNNPEELAQAVQDGRTVEVTYDGKLWRPTICSTTAGFSKHISYGNRYRIGPHV